MSNPIGWCDITMNPFVGCSKCSPGCDNCYAERFAARLVRNPKTAQKYRRVIDANGHWNGKVYGQFANWPSPSAKKGKRIFVGSMCDIFHENVKVPSLLRMFAVLSLCPQHTFLFLTKRPEKMRYVFTEYNTDRLHKNRQEVANILSLENPQPVQWPPSNFWLGVTVCNQQEANAKVPALLDIPAAKRFVSVEPMLGPVDLSPWDVCDECGHRRNEFDPYNDLGSPWVGDICYNHYCDRSCEGTFSKHSLDWVICGGETGPGARSMHPDWARTLRDQCAAAGVPFYFKGWGGNGKKAAPLLDGREWHQFPEVSNA
ncbi:phage Gp37/Gp68 family protein [uncultured Desulfovibrio sp.]|uniref:phage Gp37/Gp68 family protein n=1 Tax=uncultured Desulfovibrio sp. TaxID=167968 RepID=UPI002623158B|nr:phage Gp37/Gp68 family protein [uncultured Desulfovibrio sp.]